MSIMSLARKALTVAGQSKARPVRGTPSYHRPVRYHTSPKQAAARTAVREIGRALRK